MENKILKGKVTNIKGFGAFLTFPNKKVGMIHISEISDKFVQSIDDFFDVGDEIEVLVLSEVDDKYTLSYKQVPTNNVDIEVGFGPLRRNLKNWVKDELNNEKN